MIEDLQLDILLLDVKMPELDGLKVLPQVQAKSPRTKVLVLSGFLEDDFINEALEHGAKGFMPKTITHEDITKAIRVTYWGKLWVKRKAVAGAMEYLRKKLQNLHEPLSDIGQNLTKREQEVVRYVNQGMTKKSRHPARD